jgi:CDP-paratose 2-epimerase
LHWKYLDEPRKGDHICYISDLRKLRAHFPNWELTYDLNCILEEIVQVERNQVRIAQGI